MAPPKEPSKEEEGSRRLQRHSPRRKTQAKTVSYAESEKESSSLEEEEEEIISTTRRGRKRSSSEAAVNKKGKSNKKKQGAEASYTKKPKGRPAKKPENNVDGAENDEELSCEYCGKTFSSALGLKYHSEKFVCRPNLRPEADLSRKKASNRVKKEESSDDEEDEDEDDVSASSEEEPEDDDNALPSTKPKRKRSPLVKSKGKDGSGEDLVCQYCNKKMSTLSGLNYHIDKFVCRPEMKADAAEGKPAKKRGRGKSLPNSERKKKRIRGKLTDRTCPKCKRVFTSVLGKDYHVSNRVCEQTAAKGSSREAMFASLTPGMKFITTYGVVEVVDDSRAVPTAELPDDAQQRFKLWRTSRSKVENKRKGNYDSVAVHSLARKKRFHQLYEKNLTSTIHVTQAYFCKQTAESLGGRNFPKVTKYPLNNPNPMEPNGCHLDRIVECRSVVDKRSLCIVHMGELDGERKLVVTEQKDDKLPSQNDTTYMKLFLRRRDLSVAYREGFSTKYTCRECGKLFFSIDGLKYHCRTNACTKQAKAKKEEAAMRLEYIDSRANRLAKGLEQLQTGVEPSSSTSVHSKTSTSRRPQSNGFKSERRQSSKPDVFAPPKPKGIKPLWRKSTPKRERDAIYPQVWKALGFKIVPSSKKEPRVSMFGDTRKKKRKDLSNIHQQSTPSFRLIDVEHPSALDSEYDRLKAELEKVQSEKLGPMYPEVYTFLKFGALGEAFDQVPKPEPEPKEQDPFVPRPPAYNFPPAIIDVDVLAGEIDSGRYPSMKRNKNNDADAHEDVCYICRDPRGLLYMCDFCPRVNHLECIRSRFIIKDPEPQCDFMCNKCIQTISWRRRRAEKRRLKKQGLAEKQEEGATVDPAQVSAEMQADELVEEGKELEFIQKRAGNVDEIMLLLKDSRLRLKQLVETTKINDFRRKQLID